jgi:nickel/cobalt transporter (NicO) family protein
VNVPAFASIVAAGVVVAFLHAATPTHWLPFVLVGRAQAWSRARTLGVTALAGLGHSLFTAALGLAVTGVGLMVEPQLGRLFPRLVGLGLIAFGVFYIVRHARRPAEALAPAQPVRRYGSDAAAVWGLVALLTFTPSEALLPVYLANVDQGWQGFATLSVVLTTATTVGMLLFTSLFMAGAHWLRLERLARYELLLVGAILCAFGLYVALKT